MAQVNRKRLRSGDSNSDSENSSSTSIGEDTHAQPYNLASESQKPSNSARICRPRLQPDIEKDADQYSLGPLRRRQTSGHDYHSAHASGNASIHQGDNYYYTSTENKSLLAKLLASLDFPQRRSRFDDVEEKYGQTFYWVLQPYSDQQPAWDSFQDWLYSAGKIYWVSGKPGSGKSTLMKHLYTTTANRMSPLRSKQVISFWFWEAAHEELERTLKGCLRSLLWQVLQNPETNFDIADALQIYDGYEWTRSSLQQAFNTALNILNSKHISTFIFLDGLDESGLDRELLVKFVINTNRDLPKVKFCVSSRHEPLFEARLAVYPKLRMQDLNGPDMDLIIEKDLLKSPEYTALCRSDRQIDELEIRDNLREKAQGVILWVVLVVRDLLRGIRNWDTAQQLEDRIDRMPAELDKLYDMMLKRNSPESKDYRTDAAFYCQLIEHRKFDLVAFSLAINDDVRAAYLNVQEGWEVLHDRLHCERAKVWVNARTGCLLEIRYRHGSRFRLPYECSRRSRCESLTNCLDFYSGQHVDFIHRTARTYLFGSPAGQELLAASTRAATDIERLCLETAIARGTILKALESPAPIGLDVIAQNKALYSRGKECDCSSTVRSDRVVIETAMDNLQRRGLLWTELHPRDARDGIFNIDSCFVALPANRAGKLDYCRIFARIALWSYVCNDLDSQQGSRDEKMITLMPIVAPLLMRRVTFEFTEKIQSLDIKRSVDHLVLTEYQEQVWIFHELIGSLKWLPGERGIELHPTVANWLRGAQASTVWRTITPTMRACNSLFFKQAGDSNRLGRYGFLGSHGLKSLVPDHGLFHGIGIYIDLRVEKDSTSNSSGPSALVEWPRFGQRPKIYALSEDESTQLFQEHADLKKRWRDAPLLVHYEQYGIVSLDTLEADPVHAAIERQISEYFSRFKHTELPSLYAALTHINKPKESILAFAAEEEKRLALQLTDAYFQQWKAWFWGDNPEPRQEHDKVGAG